MRRIIFLLAISVFTTSVAFSNSESNELAAIEPEAKQTKLFREIVTELASTHYATLEINNVLSEQYLNNYIDRLDSSKRFFLASDIEEFQQWQHKLDDLAKRGDITVGFYIYNRLRDRATTRLQNSIDLLKSKSFKFDFSLDESIILDAENRLWLSNEQQADDFWRKAMKDSIIRLILGGKEQQEARELLIKRYKALYNQYAQRNSKDVFEQYVNAFASLYDPHSSYFTPRSSENFQINMSLSLEGIGAQLTTEDEYTEVVDVITGGPADIQGILKPKDKIVGVGQGDEDIVDVIGWRIDDVVDLIRGEKGSVVRLEIISGSSSNKIISIVRDTVKLEEKSAQSEIINIQNQGRNFKIGVIEIPTFYMDFEAYRKRDPNYRSTSRDVRKLLKELKEQAVDGVILDLRNNGGGSLFEATALTDLFIDYGPVVQIRDADQKIYRSQRAKHPAYYDGPLIVMINRLSASASEIFAGAMQDYGRALIVGSQSYGKGTVQTMSELSSGLLKYTVSKFYRVSGDSTQHRGIIPDIKLPAMFDAEEIGESHLETALPWDQVHSVPYQQFTGLNQLIKPLTATHKQRAYNEHNFVSLAEQLKLNKQWDNQEKLTVNLEKRRLRDDQLNNSLLAIENTRRKAANQKPYKDVEAWEEAQEAEDELDKDEKTKKPIAESDPFLNEAGFILSDQIKLISLEELTAQQ
ncbi:MAG: carboxy terminal-processing peptidase [Porticoccaceae bacterium]